MITFLGDVALISNGMKSEYKPHPPYVFNCEYVIGNRSELSPAVNKINLCSPNKNFTEIFGCLPAAVSVINNHAYDYGAAGFEITIAQLKNEQIGILGQSPFYLNDNCYLLAYMDLGNDSQFCFDYDAVEAELQGIRQCNNAARIVVQMHWGIENHPSASNRQRKVGHWLIDHGADLVIGHHPHCVQPIEQYKGKYICYSLGNGLFGNINQPSHFDNSRNAARIYRFRWQRWNRKTIAVNYDEVDNTISIDELYQKKNTLFCKRRNVSVKKYEDNKKNKKGRYLLRKYSLFLASNSFVDGKIFDIAALMHELRRK